MTYLGDILEIIYNIFNIQIINNVKQKGIVKIHTARNTSRKEATGYRAYE